MDDTEYNGRIFQNVKGWYIETEKSEPVKDGGSFTKKSERIEEDFDDLPFS